MPDGRYGVYADKFKNKKEYDTNKGKHAKELKKVYKNKKDANDYMAAIMIAKGGDMKSFSEFRESIIDIPRRTYAPERF